MDSILCHNVLTMKRCVIIGGAPIKEYARVRAYFSAEDDYVFCDSGLRHMEALGAKPSLIVGDFDSWHAPEGSKTECETITLPHEKDDTDTAYAVKECIRRGYDAFLLTGCAGARLDHTLGNVQLLVRLYRAGKWALLVDDHSEMEIVGRETVTVSDRFPYFSLLNITGSARSVTITDAKFPLTDAQIPTDDPYGISNETLTGKTSRVSVREGELLLVRVFPDE